MQVGENVLGKVKTAPTSIPVLFITFIMTYILWQQTNMLKYTSERSKKRHLFLVSVLKYKCKAGKVPVLFSEGQLL